MAFTVLLLVVCNHGLGTLEQGLQRLDGPASLLEPWSGSIALTKVRIWVGKLCLLTRAFVVRVLSATKLEP
jgi:hypothetical protein